MIKCHIFDHLENREKNLVLFRFQVEQGSTSFAQNEFQLRIAMISHQEIFLKSFLSKKNLFRIEKFFNVKEKRAER
jgi:hypothetical protein